MAAVAVVAFAYSLPLNWNESKPVAIVDFVVNTDYWMAFDMHSLDLYNFHTKHPHTLAIVDLSLS